MPVMDGFESTRAIREYEKKIHLSNTPIVAVTASSAETDIEMCMQCGMSEHLCKPYYRSQVYRILETHICHRD